MKTKLLLLAALAVALVIAPPAAPQAQAQGIGEVFQGILDPHIVPAVGYNTTTKKYSAILTANIVGPKLGSLSCYLMGAGVSLGSVAPGLEDVPIAAASIPFLTCAPFGEQVALQVGVAIPLNDPTGQIGKTYYFGVGIDVGGGPNQLKAKRVKRIEAKAKAKKAEVDHDGLAGPPAPLT